MCRLTLLNTAGSLVSVALVYYIACISISFSLTLSFLTADVEFIGNESSYICLIGLNCKLFFFPHYVTQNAPGFHPGCLKTRAGHLMKFLSYFSLLIFFHSTSLHPSSFPPLFAFILCPFFHSTSNLLSSFPLSYTISLPILSLSLTLSVSRLSLLSPLFPLAPVLPHSPPSSLHYFS